MYKAINKTQNLVSLASLVMLMVSGMSSALSATSNTASASTTSASPASEIKIKADYMAFDLETGKNLYEGNVSIVQGSIELTGDKVTILRSNNKVSEIEVTGNPAHYLQDENTENIVRAISQQIHYSAQKNRLVLIDNASLEQSDHTVKSQRIVYDTEKKMIIAGQAGDEKSTEENNGSKQRVDITLTPKKDSQKNPSEK
jgi:lipopolysaccharide export system protein LptA